LSDVSSVALDWLYLRTHAPLWICDARDDRDRLLEASPLAAHTYVLEPSSLGRVADRVGESLEADPRREDRQAARRLYFGDLARGESTQRFIEAIDALMDHRDALLEAKKSGDSVVDPPATAYLGSSETA
jgi:hypothetical protein